jgi:hypothetical protein
MTMGQLHSGVHQPLDDAATELIRQSLEGVTSMKEKSDVLTPWTEMDRRKREVYVEDGVPDAALRRGMYHRAWNSSAPHLNSVEGKAPPLPSALRTGRSDPRFHRNASTVEAGEVYDLRVYWGQQSRVKCPVCAKYMKRDALEITCRCGSIYSKTTDDGHYQVIRIRHGH